MYSRSLKLLSLLALLLAITQASWIDRAVFSRRADSSAVALSSGGDGRTSGPTGNAADDTTPVAPKTFVAPTASAAPTTSAESTSDAPKPTTSATSRDPATTTSAAPTTPSEPSSSASTPVSVPESSSTSSAASETSASITSEAAPESKTSETSATTTSSIETTKTSSSASKSTVFSEITITPSPSQVVITIVSTAEGGVQVTSKLTTSTTGSAYTTQTAIITNDGSSSPKGMSTDTRNTIIGVTVGLGGAILLGGLFIVAWKIWGRNKTEDDDDGLMGGYDPVSAGIEKTEGTTAPNPFQSTLEGYHQPGRGNVSANF